MNTLFFFLAFMSVFSVGSAVSSMPLSGFLKGLLAASPAIMGMFTQVPVAIQVDKNGGKWAALIFRSISLVGLVGLSVFSALVDFSTMDSFDGRYLLMLLCTCLVGTAFSAFPLPPRSFSLGGEPVQNLWINYSLLQIILLPPLA